MVLEGFFNWVFGPFLKLGDVWAILVVSFLLMVITVVIQKVTTNQVEMKRLKEEQKAFQKKMKELKGDPDKLMSAQKEAMQKNLEYMKHSMRSLVYTMIPVLLVFGWLAKTFGEKGDVLSWSVKIPLFGTGLGWLGSYILFSILFSMVLRKLLKVY